MEQTSQRQTLSFRKWIAVTDPKFQFYAHVDKLIAVLQRVADGEIKRLMVFMPPRHGKCLVAGTLVQMGDGSLRSIEQVCPHDIVMSKHSCYNIGRSIVTNIYTNGVKPVRRITLVSGRTITCTDNHPFLTVHGWKQAEGLGIGDCVAAARQLPAIEGKALPAHLARLMGYIVGDGSFGKGNVIITNVDPSVEADLRAIANANGWRVWVDWAKTGGQSYHLRVRAKGEKGRTRHEPNAPHNILSTYMKPGNAYTKTVPDALFTATDDDVAEFLAAYFICDGHCQGQREGIAEYTSASEELLRGVQYLLMHFGIVGYLRTKVQKYKGEHRSYWRLSISGGEMVKFADRIPVIGAKGERLRLLAEQARQRNHYPEFDAIPSGWKQYMKRTASWHRVNTGVRVDKQYKHGTARFLVVAVAEAENNDYLRKLCHPDIIWERIVQVELLDPEPTYDIEVEGTHNFIANGIVVHNSETISRKFSAYYLYRHPQRWVAITSYGAKLAYALSRSARDHFTWGGGQLNSNAAAVEYWKTQQGGGLWAAGVGGPQGGFGYHLGIIDDPIKDAEQAGSELIREKQKDWYRSVFSTREEPDGAQVIVNTRWHEDDLSGWLLAQETDEDDDSPEHWHIVNMPAIAEEAQVFPPTCTVEPDEREIGEPLCPERYPLDKLQRLQKRIGEYFFNALFQGRPQPLDGDLFKRSDFTIVQAHPSTIWRVRYWDKAASISKTAKYSAGVRLAISNDGRVFIEDVKRGQWRTSERRQVMLQTAQLDRQSVGEVITYIEQEPGSSGLDSVQDEIRLLMGYAVFADRPSGDKDTRMLPLSGQAQAGNVYLVSGAWNEDFITEMCAIPKGRYRDQADAASGAFNRLVEIINTQPEGTAVYDDYVQISPI